jgi:cytochrome c553
MKRALVATVALLPGILALAVCSGPQPQLGKAKSVACEACHGADGNSTNPQFPRLAGQHEDYLVRALTDYRSGARRNPIMAGFASGLTDADIANLAAYYARQPRGVHEKW